MSRIGRVPVPVPTGVDVNINGAVVTVKGPKGTLTHTIPAPIEVARDEAGALVVTRPNDKRASRSLHGLTATLPAARPHAHAAGEPGHRCHRGLRQEARDRRYRLPRDGEGRGSRVRARLQPP